MVLDDSFHHPQAERRISGHSAKLRACEVYGSEVPKRQASANVGLPEGSGAKVAIANSSEEMLEVVLVDARHYSIRVRLRIGANRNGSGFMVEVERERVERELFLLELVKSSSHHVVQQRLEASHLFRLANGQCKLRLRHTHLQSRELYRRSRQLDAMLGPALATSPVARERRPR